MKTSLKIFFALIFLPFVPKAQTKSALLCNGELEYVKVGTLNLFERSFLQMNKQKRGKIVLGFCKDSLKIIKARKDGFRKEWQVQYKDSLTLLTADRVNINGVLIADSSIVTPLYCLQKISFYNGHQIEKQGICFYDFSTKTRYFFRYLLSTLGPFNLDKYWNSGISLPKEILNYIDSLSKEKYQFENLSKKYSGKDLKTELIWFLFTKSL